jgi:hypothetical protein
MKGRASGPGAGRQEDLREDSFLVGRMEELSRLVDNLRRGQHTLLVGERGVGKTTLMREALDVLSGVKHWPGVRANGERKGGRWIIYVWHCSPVGDLLKEICAKLHGNQELDLKAFGEVDPAEWSAIKKKLTGLGSVGVQNLAIDSMRSSRARYLIFLDSLDRITQAHQQFLERLLSVAVVCAAVVRMKEGIMFRKIWSSFSRINLLPLTQDESKRLILHLLESYPVRVVDRQMYIRQVLKASGGNPFSIRNLIWHGTLERVLGEKEIRMLQREEEGELMNMGPAYIFLASIFTLFKIFSVGMDNSEFYIYFSALGFLVYLTFRVFRSFFLFRPQRQ